MSANETSTAYEQGRITGRWHREHGVMPSPLTEEDTDFSKGWRDGYYHEQVATPNRHRGAYAFPHQSKAIGRDLTGEKIAKNFGGRAFAYRLTAEQLQERKDGKPGTGLPYEYLVYTPESAATNWTAFYEWIDLMSFCDAYCIELERQDGTRINRFADDVAEGERFWLRLPGGAGEWIPVCDAEPGHVCGVKS